MLNNTKFKHSQFQWIGEVPEHWKIIRHKYLFRKDKQIVGGNERDYPVLSLSIKGVIEKDREDAFGKIPAKYENYYQIAKENSILLCLFDMDVTPRLSGYVNKTGIVSPAYTNLIPLNIKTVNMRFYNYWYLRMDEENLFVQLSNNVRSSINANEFMRIFTVHPPMHEQQAIAAFLDHKTSEIDTLITDKEKLIELLKEQRQAIITEAVTKGLNPDVKMKDSGVEWIGEVPEHWRVSKVKYIAKSLDSKRIPLSSEERGNMQGDIPYWGANCIIDYVNDWLIDGEVVLLGEDGAPFFDKNKNVSFYSNEKIWPNNHVHILRATKIHSKLLMYILNTVDYSNYIMGSTRDKLTQSDMKRIAVHLATPLEQQTIANFLDHKTSEIDALITKESTQIEKLKSYRQSLIYEVVTGKIDVRNWSDKPLERSDTVANA